jgi:hypothetical protein
MPKLDDASYQRGAAFFGSGKRIRDVIDEMQAGNLGSGEVEEMSFMVGFADALLTKLRGA